MKVSMKCPLNLSRKFQFLLLSRLHETFFEISPKLSVNFLWRNFQPLFLSRFHETLFATFWRLSVKFAFNLSINFWLVFPETVSETLLNPSGKFHWNLLLTFQGTFNEICFGSLKEVSINSTVSLSWNLQWNLSLSFSNILLWINETYC